MRSLSVYSAAGSAISPSGTEFVAFTRTMTCMDCLLGSQSIVAGTPQDGRRIYPRPGARGLCCFPPALHSREHAAHDENADAGTAHLGLAKGLERARERADAIAFNKARA